MTVQGSRVDALVDCFARHGSAALIANLSTRVERLDLNGHVFPITINDGGRPGNCYICNPVTGYTDYAIEETRNFVSHPLLRRGLVGLIRATAPVLRATGLDRSVHVNNWLFSTNPAPDIDRATAAAMRDGLVARFPAHGLLIRSLNTYADQAALDALGAEGFTLLPSRQIYLFDGCATGAATKDMKRDRALLRKTPLQMVGNDGFGPGDFEQSARLYAQLYLDKYTALNPQYTATFLAEMHRAGLLCMEGFRDADGRLAAVGGRFVYGRTLTQPLLGYDTSRPQKDGLYRLITATAQRDAMDEGLLFNMSAGAAGFKRLRGAVPAVEYSAVYTRHLPGGQRRATAVISGLLTRIGIPLLQRFEL
ncbi:MAG: GNAT family N-acetyltransferase [Pseudomonadota bacterium]